MIPFWMRKSSSSIDQCLRQSMRTPVSEPNQVKLFPYQTNTNYSASQILVLHRAIEGVRVNVRTLKHDQLRSVVRAYLDKRAPKRNLLLYLPNIEDKEDSNSHWLTFDYAAWRLCDGSCFWRTFDIMPVDTLPARRIEIEPLRSPPIKFSLWNRVFLPPGVEDQKAYWLETLIRFLDCAEQLNKGNKVALLVITSTSSHKLVDLLNVVLIELQLTPPHSTSI